MKPDYRSWASKGDGRLHVAIILAVMASVSAAALAYAISEPVEITPVAQKLPPAPPLFLRDIPMERASSINREIPFSKEPNPAAQPFRLKGTKQDHARALECLTTAIYYEGALEPDEGQRAIAQVILNRVRHPAFPSNVCDVVYEGFSRPTGCQFSFTCDGSLRRAPVAALWARARNSAKSALAGSSFEPVGYATHYHADYVVPYWATSLAKNAVVGRHIFYRWPGAWGRRPAFVKAYFAKEADPLWLRAVAVARWRGQTMKPALPKVALTVSVDPRVELISIVNLLARRLPPDKNDSPYVRETRARFTRHSNHVAVLIYRQLLNEADGMSVGSATELLMHYSPTPQLALRHKIPAELAARAGGGVALSGFINALRDFAKQSSFDRFFQSKNSFYLTLVSRNQNPSVAFATQLQKYSGMPIGEGTIVLAPLLQDGPVPGCLPQMSAANSWFVITPTTASGPVRLGWRTGYANESVRYALASRIVTSFLKKKAAPNACTIGSSRSARDDQETRDFILAVISRVDALSSGEPTNRREDIFLPKRSTALAQELKLFEVSRDSYLTLGEFHRTVIQNSADRDKTRRPG